MSNLMIFSGNANLTLANTICTHLDRPMGKATIGRFSDGEIMVEILENVRGMDVFIIQSTSTPCNDNLMELMLMADALRRASAMRITAVLPYFGYARQDRRVRSARVAISAKVVADMLGSVGIDRILTVDLHADQIQGFFYMPVDNVYATPEVIKDVEGKHFANPKVVSPDVGGVVRARAIAKRMNDADLAIIDKRRPEANQAQVMNVLGQVEGRDCIIVDDMVDTAGTLCKAADALMSHGATTVTAYCTHPVLSDPAVERIADSIIDELIVTDTIALSADAMNCEKIRQIPLGALIAKAIQRINEEESLSSMFPE